jgi:hypothetical protein
VGIEGTDSIRYTFRCFDVTRSAKSFHEMPVTAKLVFSFSYRGFSFKPDRLCRYPSIRTLLVSDCCSVQVGVLNSAGAAMKRAHRQLAQTIFVVVTQFDREDARSVLKSTGRSGRYKTVVRRWIGSCSGRPYFGRASVCSIENQTESLAFFCPTVHSLFIRLYWNASPVLGSVLWLLILFRL